MENNTDTKPQQKIAYIWLIILTIIIALTGMAGLGIFYFHLKEMQYNSADTKALAEAARSQSKNTEILATAAVNTVAATRQTVKNAEANLKITREATRLEQRAWVFVGMIRSDKPEVGKPFAVRVDFKNTGRTPAKNVTVSAILEPLQKGSSPNHTLSAPPVSQGPIPPNGGTMVFLRPLPQSATLDESTVNNLSSGQIQIFIHGIIKYDDIFRKHHWSSFCYYMEPDGSAFNVCNEHNETDEN